MKAKPLFFFLLVIAALGAYLTALRMGTRQSDTALVQVKSDAAASDAETISSPTIAPPAQLFTPSRDIGISPEISDQPAQVTNKLQRLADLREAFRELAGGDPASAIHSAKALTNDNERETALMTLATEWTRGELGPSRQRAQRIAFLGLEAGLGMELLQKPELGLLWANELTQGDAKTTLLQQLAIATVQSDPNAARALSAQVPEGDRPDFVRQMYAGWAMSDTTAALDFATRLQDPTKQRTALEGIRQVAPVGIGAELRTDNGYQVINRLLPGSPAEVSGQLRPGDRIIGMADGNNPFIDARGLSLSDVVQRVRGAPGTVLQLQVLPADAPADSTPRTVTIVREQILHKK